jgi:hypothetical protein
MPILRYLLAFLVVTFVSIDVSVPLAAFGFEVSLHPIKVKAQKQHVNYANSLIALILSLKT